MDIIGIERDKKNGRVLGYAYRVLLFLCILRGMADFAGWVIRMSLHKLPSMLGIDPYVNPSLFVTVMVPLGMLLVFTLSTILFVPIVTLCISRDMGSAIDGVLNEVQNSTKQRVLKWLSSSPQKQT